GPAMNRFLLVIWAVLALPALGRAEVLVQTPVGTFIFGRPAPRCGPAVDVQVGRIVGVHVHPAPLPPPPLPAPPPVILPPPTPDGPLPIGPPPRPVEARPTAMTLHDFAASFKPCPGRYEVYIMHPKTGEP